MAVIFLYENPKSGGVNLINNPKTLWKSEQEFIVQKMSSFCILINKLNAKID